MIGAKHGYEETRNPTPLGFLAACILAASILMGCPPEPSPRSAPKPTPSSPALLPGPAPPLHHEGPPKRPLIVDLHADTLWQMRDTGAHFPDRGSALEVSLEKARAGGLGAQFFSVWMPEKTQRPLREAHTLIDLFEAEIAAAPDVGLALSAEDIERLRSEGRFAALLGLEGGLALEGRPENLRGLHKRGVRYMALTWNKATPFGDGAQEQRHGGITPDGIALVALMNELGVIVDVSHAAPETFWGVLLTSHKPVVATHSNAAAIHPHARNLDDAQLWAIAASGGVVGLNFHAAFVKAGKKASIPDLMAHVRHLGAVMGWEHVALGSDFDGNIRTPVDLGDASALPALVTALSELPGADPDRTRAVLGDNVLRVLRQTQASGGARKVRFRPAAILQTSDARATDRSTRTAWTPGAGGVLRIVAGPGVARVSICASSPGEPSGVTAVRVTALRPDGTPFLSETLALTDAVRPHPLALPGAEVLPEVRLEIEIEATDPKRGPIQLAEVLPETSGAIR